MSGSRHSERNIDLFLGWQGFYFHLFSAHLGDAHRDQRVGVGFFALHFEQVDRLEKIDEFLEAVSAVIEGALVVDSVGDVGKVRPAFLVGGGFDGIAEGVDELGVALEVLVGLELGFRFRAGTGAGLGGLFLRLPDIDPVLCRAAHRAAFRDLEGAGELIEVGQWSTHAPFVG